MQIIANPSREEWLAHKSRVITSTDAPALFGCSPYQTYFELWHRKREAQMVELDTNERMKWGSRLEETIARGVAEDEGLDIHPFKDFLFDSHFGIGSSFDYRIKDPSGDTTKDGILEIKNVDGLQFLKTWATYDDGSVEAPPHIEIQVQHQMWVAGLSYAKIRAFIGGNKIIKIERARDQKIIDAIAQKVIDFWRSINENREPAPDYGRDSKFLISLYQYAEPGKFLDGSRNEVLPPLIEAYTKAREEVKHYSGIVEEMKARILQTIGDAEKVKGEGWSISCGLIGPTKIAYERKGYRDFRIYAKKKTEGI